MQFAAQAGAVVTPATDSFLLGQQQTIDLLQYGFADGAEVGPVVTVDLDARREPPPAAQAIRYKINGVTAIYDVTGTIFDWEIKFDGSVAPPNDGPTLPGFPDDIEVALGKYANWDQAIQADDIWTCYPKCKKEVETVCNWAKQYGYQVRPSGIKHGWSPLTLPTVSTPDTKVILLNLARHCKKATFLPAADGLPNRVKVEAGMTMLDLMTFLEQQAGGTGSAPGYSFPHIPAPGNLTVGGVLAIDAHGTAIPVAPNDDFAASYGSISNQILELTAVVSDPDSPKHEYTSQRFKRTDPDAKLFLTHLGRALLFDVTLQVVDNYNLRCQSFTDFTPATLFAAPTVNSPVPANSFAEFLQRYGRVEIIWLRKEKNPWLHVWQVAPEKPAASTEVTAPNNYKFMQNLPDFAINLLDAILGGFPQGTPLFTSSMADFTSSALNGGWFFSPTNDLWGASKNTLIYVEDSTLKVTANGYALQMRKQDVQQAVHDFTQKFAQLLTQYEGDGKYPVNSAVEIRVTSLDDPAKVQVGPGGGAESPVISAIGVDELSRKNGWDVALWVDVLTIPGTASSNAFYADLEQWILEHFSKNGRVLPEWSKGWAYTAQYGPWSNKQVLQQVRQVLTDGREGQADWRYEVEGLARYDQSNLFSNAFLDRLFVQ